jgi:hypothetical protein
MAKNKITGKQILDNTITTDKLVTGWDSPFVKLSDVYITNGELVFKDPTRANKILSSNQLSFSVGRNATNVTNSYLEFVGIFSNQTGYVLPYDCTLVGIGMTSNYGASQTWTAEVRKNAVATAINSLTITASDKNYDSTLNTDYNIGDVIQIYLNGTGISRPSITLYFRRRF